MSAPASALSDFTANVSATDAMANEHADESPAQVNRASGRLREKRVNYASVQDDDEIDAAATDDDDDNVDDIEPHTKSNTAKGALTRKASAANAWADAEEFVGKGKMKAVADDGSNVSLPTGITCLESAGSAGYAARNIKVSNANFKTINNHVLSIKDDMRSTRAEFSERFGGFKASMDSLNEFVRNAVGTMQQSQASGAADIIAAVTLQMKSALAGDGSASNTATGSAVKTIKSEKQPYIAENDVKSFYDQWEYERSLRNTSRFVPRGLLEDDAVQGREEGMRAREREEAVRALQLAETTRAKEREDAIRAREKAKAAQIARIAELEHEIYSLRTKTAALNAADFEPQLQSAAATAKKPAALVNAAGKRNRDPESDDDDIIILSEGPAAARHVKKSRASLASTSATFDDGDAPGAIIRLGPHNWGTRMREIKADVMRVFNHMPDCHHIRGPGTVTICKNKSFILMSMRTGKEADIIVAQWLQAAKKSEKFKECLATRCADNEVHI